MGQKDHRLLADLKLAAAHQHLPVALSHVVDRAAAAVMSEVAVVEAVAMNAVAAVVEIKETSQDRDRKIVRASSTCVCLLVCNPKQKGCEKSQPFLS